MQLVLIVDYILDWARDIYRPNILRQLKTLSSSSMDDAMTVGFDPDVFSLAGEIQPWMEEVEAQNFDLIAEDIPSPPQLDAAASSEHDEEQADHFAQFKTSYGLVRDARRIESRIRALFLTADNAHTLFEGFDNPKKATTFARSVLASLSRRCIVLENEEVLNSIADRWTGKASKRSSPSGTPSRLYVQFRVSYYVNHAWEQVRELTYLAASEEARELLIETAEFRKVRHRWRFNIPECSTEDMLSIIDDLLKRSVRRDFIAALARRTYMLDMEYVKTPNGGPYVYPPAFKMVPKLDQDKKSPGVAMQELVHAIYEKYRIGKREPCEPFLHASSRLDLESRPLWRGWKAGDELPRRQRHLDKVLVYADVMNAPFLPKGSDRKLCLFVLDGKIVTQPFDVSAKLLRFLYRDEIYTTVRKGRVYRTRINWKDNRTEHFCKIEKVEEAVNIKPVELRGFVFEWIKLLNSSEGDLDGGT